MSDNTFDPSELNARIKVAANGAALAVLITAGFEKVDFDKIKPGDVVYVPKYNSVLTVIGEADSDYDYPLDYGYLFAKQHKDSGVWRHPAPSPTSVSPTRHPNYTVARVHFKDGVAVCFMNTRGDWFPIGGDHLETEWDSPDVVAVYVLHRPLDNTEPTLTTLRDNPGRIAIGRSDTRWMYGEGDFWFWDDGDDVRTQGTTYWPNEFNMKGAKWADPSVTAPECKLYDDKPRYQNLVEQRGL